MSTTSAKTTFIVETSDGRTHTRSSDRADYSHAVEATMSDGTVLIASWHKTRDAALKRSDALDRGVGHVPMPDYYVSATHVKAVVLHEVSGAPFGSAQAKQARRTEKDQKNSGAPVAQTSVPQDFPVTEQINRVAASAAYLEGNDHRAGMRKALTAAGVYTLPARGVDRPTVLSVALALYPDQVPADHDARLGAAVVAGARAWVGLDPVAE
ncbi:hypothetical protein ACWDUL_21280 [Nocardia niigatensis]